MSMYSDYLRRKSHDALKFGYSDGFPNMITNSKGRYLKNYDIYGNTIQSNKNVLPYPYIETTKTQNGVTFTANGDGTITVNGTATANMEFQLCRLSLSAHNNLKIDGIYELTGCPSGGSRTTDMLVWDTVGYDIGSGLTKRVINSSLSRVIAIIIRSGTECNNLVFKPMFKFVDTLSNLIKYPFATSNTTINGITVTESPLNVYRDCYYQLVLSGTASASTSIPITSNENFTLAQGKYQLSGCPSTGSSDTYYMFCDLLKYSSDGSYSVVKSFIDVGARIEFDTTGLDYNGVLIGIRIENGVTIPNNTTFTPNIKKIGYESQVPTFDNPIEIKSCGIPSVSKNLFNESLLVIPGRDSCSKVHNGYSINKYPVGYSPYGVSIGSAMFNQFKSVLKPDTYYTFSTNVLNYHEKPGKICGAIVIRTKNEETGKDKDIQLIERGPGYKTGTFKLTQYQIDNLTFLFFYGWSAPDDIIFEFVQLELGETATAYQPYQDISELKSMIPMNICGKNLFDMSKITEFVLKSDYSSAIYIGTISNGIATMNRGSYSDTYFWKDSKLTLPTGTYTISADFMADKDSGDKRVTFGFNDFISNTIFRRTKTLSEYKVWERFSATFTISNSHAILVFIFQGIGTAEDFTNLNIKIKNIQIEQSSVMTDYESYQNPKSINIYTKDTLKRIDESIIDQIDFRNQEILQNIGEVTLNGSENWQLISENVVGIDIPSLVFNGTSKTYVSTGPFVANKSTDTTYTGFTADDVNPNRLLYRKDGITVDSMKALLQSQNTQVVSALQNPIRSSIELVKLPSQVGGTTYNSDLDVSPNNMKTKYIRK